MSSIICRPSCPLAHFLPLTLCSSHHQVVLNVLATMFAGTVKVEMLLQLLLAVSRQVEEVHIADSQLLTLGDSPHSSQLNPGTKKDRTGSGFLDLMIHVYVLRYRSALSGCNKSQYRISACRLVLLKSVVES